MSSLGGHCNQWTLIEESSIPADDVKEFKLESKLTSLSCLVLISFFYSRAAASLMMVWVGIVLVVVQGTFVSLVNSSFIKAMPLGF